MSERVPAGGRPRHGAEPKGKSLNLKTTADIRERLETAAAEAGRSLTQEVELRLEQSLNDRGPLPEPHTRMLLLKIASFVAHVEKERGEKWTDTRAAYAQIVSGINRLLLRFDPGSIPEELQEFDVLVQQYELATAEYESRLNDYAKVHPDMPIAPPPPAIQYVNGKSELKRAIELGEAMVDRLFYPPTTRTSPYSLEPRAPRGGV